jgi:hypothetical protein
MRTIIILFSALLVACATTEPQTPVILLNKEKDIYLEKVESIVSDSASALSAIVPSVPVGTARELIENQITRLSGVSKPTAERTQFYRRILETQDSSAVKKDKEEALKVDSETEKLWAMVEEQETALAIAQAIADNAEKERQGAIKDKILWMVSCIGMAISVAGLAVIVFTPWKLRGIGLIAGGAFATASAWILDTQWFAWIVGTGIAIAIIDGLYILIRETINRHRHPKVRDTPQDNSELQP